MKGSISASCLNGFQTLCARMVVPLLRSRLRERYLWPQMEIPWTQLGRFDRNQMSVLQPFAVREQVLAIRPLGARDPDKSGARHD